jgi:uncharacterized DUF497 family protein
MRPRFSWDESKREQNLRRHGIDFVDAEDVFAGLTMTIEDDRFDYDERRYITFGILHSVVVVAAHTETEEEIRVISMRKATRNEQETFFRQLSHGSDSAPGDE